MFDGIEKIENADLKNFSTMKIGGRARWLLFPKSIKEIKQILNVCEKNNIKIFILGNGSNVLFDDRGFQGAILSLKKFDKIKILNGKKRNLKNKKIIKNIRKLTKNTDFCCFLDKKYYFFCKKITEIVEIEAGLNLFALNICLAQKGLSGLEFCYGIPATFGGFLYMNGGCFGYEIGQFVEEVKVLVHDKNSKKWKIQKKNKKDLIFGYRTSNLQDCIILSAKLRLFCDREENILKKMNYFIEKKRSLQPCEFPSLGSVFKRVCLENGAFAYPAKILDELGLKGFSVGGAQVSSKHAGFIINTGNASSNDVSVLIDLLKKKLENFGVEPQTEIIILKER